ncbi:hypothetical protein D3C75_1323560 [compost metagenome]
MLLLDRGGNEGNAKPCRDKTQGGLQLVGPLGYLYAHAMVGEQRQDMVGVTGPRVGRVKYKAFL